MKTLIPYVLLLVTLQPQDKPKTPRKPALRVRVGEIEEYLRAYTKSTNEAIDKLRDWAVLADLGSAARAFCEGFPPCRRIKASICRGLHVTIPASEV